MNVCTLVGNMTAEPERRGDKVVTFTIAVQRRFKREGQPDADFFDCVCFSSTADYVEKYGEKGTKVAVHGSIQNNSFQTKNGETRRSTSISCDNVEIYGKRGASSAGSSKAATNAPKASSDSFVNVADGMDEELPFG